MKPGLNKGRFNEEEDLRIMIGEKVFGAQWEKIARFVGVDRVGVQVRERWKTVLSGELS